MNMSQTTNQLPAPDTLSALILTFTALSGELPAALIRRLPGSGSYVEYAVKRLKRDNLLRTFYRDGLRGLRLTAAAKKLLLTAYPDRFSPYLTGHIETNELKGEITRRLRLHRMAEVLLTMYNAGVSSFPWEKPAVFQPKPPPPDLSFERPAYFTSREVKEIGPQAAKIRGSRAAGVLLVDGGIFMIYNTGASRMRWEYKAELRLKALLQMELCRYRLPAQFMDAGLSAIVFGSDMDGLAHLMGPGDSRTRNYFVLDGSIEHFYYLTSDHHGEVLLQLLCEPALQAALDDLLLEDLCESQPGPVENDAVDKSGKPILFGYTCDMPRIRRFDTALELHGQEGLIFCFDFQEEILRRVCGSRVAFQSIDFSAVERSVSPYLANN